MYYIGIDVHSKWSTFVALDPTTGETITFDRVPNTPADIAERLGSLKSPLKGMLESGTNAWAMYRTLAPLFEEIVVVSPAELWDRRRDDAKTDKRDCLGMATRLYRGDYTPLYIPDETTQDLRNLVRAKIQASRHVTKLVNEIGSLVRSWGHILPGSLLGKQGQAWLATVQLPAHSARALELWRAELGRFLAVEAELERSIVEEAARDEVCRQLMTIPNVGAFTALAIRAEVGDIRRFRSVDALIRYCGLAPRVFQSGEKRAYGRLGKQHNHWLRYVVMLFAQRCGRSRTETPFRRTYWRVSLRQHRNSAKVAVARQFVRVFSTMWRRGTVWDAARGQRTPRAA